MKLSVVIPAHNEEGVIADTLRGLYAALREADISHELVVVDDSSTDDTADVVQAVAKEVPSVCLVTNAPPNGYGFAVRCGIDAAQAEYVAIIMADASDDPADLVAFYRKAEEGYDAVFGNRFAREGEVVDYPWFKLILNRITNWIICMLFAIRHTDTTNAFKLYRRDTLEGLKPFLSHHFNLTVELPLKTIVRGYSYAVLPNRWYNRKHGESKLKIKEMGSRYWFVIFYCLLEKWLSVGDYHRK
jgi:dolichol-phosphate mannosyltransferase